MIDLPSRILPIQDGLDLKLRDPLSFWHFAVPRFKPAFSLFTDPDPIEELHARGPNSTGKTESVCAFVLRCLQKAKSLDGVPIPQWDGRVEGLCLVLDYKQQLLSVQPAYLRLLGKWPHHAKYVGEYLSTLYVKPAGDWSDDHTTWSVLHFLSQENKRSGVGARADVVHFDEPPVIEILRELRKAGHHKRRCIRIIGETPEHRRQWAPLRDDYGDPPRNTLTRVDAHKAEVRWSLSEVAKWLLSPEAKRNLMAKYKGDPLYEARVFGDYTNTDGKCPFDAITLNQMLAECKDAEIRRWRVARETSEGIPNAVTTVEYEVWQPPKAGAQYYIDIDPSSGVDDGSHNPACIHISERGSGDLVARWNGYLAPFSVGVLAAGLALQYNHAVIDVETNDHYGTTVVKGIWACRYGNLAHDTKTLLPGGDYSQTVGWRATEQSRAEIIGAIQQWIEDWRSGIKYAACPSRHAIECLLDTELDDRGKIVAGPGVAHGEDMILLGRKLCKAVRRPNRDIRLPEEAIKTPDDLIVEQIFRKRVDDDDDAEVIMRPKARP